MTPDFFPRERFYCLLDEQPDFLVPERLVPRAEANRALMVNPHCWFGWHGALPPRLAARATRTAQFLEMPWIVWVDDTALQALWPYWLGPTYAHLLAGFEPGMRYEGGLPGGAEAVLRAAQILVPPDYAERRRRAWLDALPWHASQFVRGHVSLSGLLPPFQLGALRRYYRYHTRVGTFAFGDGQTPGRFVAYDESVTDYFHHQLSTIVSDLAARLVVPSYSYLAFYQGGAWLDPHVDRDACEYTISLAIDATPEPGAQVPWPLQLQTSDGTLAVWQHLGDGLLFRGRYLPHWRDPLAQGYTASSVLWHFVDAPAS